MEFCSCRGRSPAADLRPHTFLALSRGHGTIAVRVVFLGAIILNKCEDSAVLHSCLQAVF